MKQIYTITPVPAPRMTYSDRFRGLPGRKPRRPCVQRYFDFAEQVRKCIADLPQPCKVTFYIEMPQSWSKKKKAEMNGQPCEGSMDVDNAYKALSDAIYYKRNDKKIWSVWIEKRWSETAHICIEKMFNGL